MLILVLKKIYLAWESAIQSVLLTITKSSLLRDFGRVEEIGQPFYTSTMCT